MGEQDPCILAPDLDAAVGSSSVSAPGPKLRLAGTLTTLTASEGERAPPPPCLQLPDFVGGGEAGEGRRGAGAAQLVSPSASPPGQSDRA
uniref:Uncharacterized protein n=1 Tax=Oryza meridionalis TaxID=40149 RepID=A0A0E0CJR2_9ORYZ